MMKDTFTLGLLLALSGISYATSPDSIAHRSFPQILNNNAGVAANSSAANSTACATGVHMIVARASTEAPGEGIIGAVATTVQQNVPGSNSEAVDYPATLTDYVSSEASGVAAMTKLITDYATRCPSSKMALLGYSQGAQVAADVMCGTSETGWPATPPMAGTAAGQNIVAIILMGDPSHVVNQTQDVGTGTKNGLFPRQNTAACGSSTKFTQSYCNSNDEFCDSGSSLEVHISYVTNFGTVAAQYIQQRAGNATTVVTGTGTDRQSQLPSATEVSTGSSRGELKGWWRWSLALGLVSAFAFSF